MVNLCIKITGANGYLGNLISNELTKNGHKVSGIKRELLYGTSSALKNKISGCDVIINLAGASILQRWTKGNMKQMYQSRVLTTKNLVKAINELPQNDRPKKIISASAIGIYENERIHDETSMKFDNGFVGKLVSDWEAAHKVLPNNVKLYICRIGLVIGKNSKTIKKMAPLFNLGLGAKISSGQQAFPFIHEKDLINAFSWIIENNGRQTIYNLVAPEEINNYDFIKEWARQLNKPVFLYIPALPLKIIMGKASSLLLNSPIVKPNALLSEDFEFEFPSIQSALSEILA